MIAGESSVPRILVVPEEFIRRSRSLRLLAAWTAYLGFIVLAALALSVLHAPITQGRAILLLLLGFAPALGCAWMLRGGPPLPGGSKNRLIYALAVILALLAFAIYACQWAVAWIKPDLTWDGNGCHIPTIHFWMLKGYVHWITPGASEWTERINSAWNATPKCAHVVHFLFLQATGLKELDNALNLLFLPMGALAVYCLARFFGADRPLSSIVACLYILAPVNVAQGVTAYVDSSTASLFISYMSLGAIACAMLSRGSIPWRLAIPLGCAFGLALSVKITGYAFAPLGAMLLMLRCLRTAASLPAIRKAFLKRSGAWLGCTLLIGGCVGCYWSIRNFTHTGNPVYPIGLSVGSSQVLPGPSYAELNEAVRKTAIAAGVDDMPRMLHAPYVWLQGLGNWPESIQKYDSREGGLGFTWLCGGVLGLCTWAALAIGNRRKPGAVPFCDADRLPALWFLIALSIFVFLLRPGNSSPRHTLWLHGLGLPVFAWAFHYLREVKLGRITPVLAIWLFGCVGIALFEAAYALFFASTSCYIAPHMRPDFASHPRAAARSFIWYDPAGYIFPESSGILFRDAIAHPMPVALVSCHNSKTILFMGQLCQPIGVRPIYFISTETASNPFALADFLARRGIRYVIHDDIEFDAQTLEQAASARESMGRIYRIYAVGPWPSFVQDPPAS